MSVATVAALEEGLVALRQHFAERYGEDLSDLAVEVHTGRPRIRGTVLVARQRHALEQLVRDWAADTATPIDLEVAVLVELPESDPRADGRRLHLNGGVPAALWSRRLGGQRISDWLPRDGAARVLLETPERWLVQLPDATVGWCERAAGDAFTADAGSAPIVRRLAPGEQVVVDAAQRAALFAAARAAAGAGIAYVLGGRDPERGLDCSSFVQGLLEVYAGAVLPRHTGDQLACGERVARSAIAAGDLVFARAQHKNWMHVGLALDGSEGDERPVAHACRLDERVRLEPLGPFLERYRYLRAQRVLRALPGSA